MVVITDLTDIKYVPHLLDHISSHPNELLYLSAKGRGFDQPGGVALLQLIFLDQVFVLDPYAYGKKLFETESSTGPSQTLSCILQDPGRLKLDSMFEACATISISISTSPSRASWICKSMMLVATSKTNRHF